MKNVITILLLIVTGVAYSQTPCVSCSGTQASGSVSSAIGYQTKATGSYTFAAGYLSEANGMRSFVMGTNSKANNIEAVAIGSYAITNADGSFAIGRLIETDPAASQSMVIGMGASSNYKLINSNLNSLMIGFNSINPTIFVGPAPTTTGYTSTGKVAIGNVVNSFGKMDPQAKLHIRADAGESASVLLEPQIWNEGAQAHINIGNEFNGISADYRGGLVFRTESAFVFNNGNVGINTGIEALPETALDVVGTVKMTGLRLVTQEAHSGYVLTCSGVNGQAAWTNPLEYSIWSLNEENEAIRMSSVGIGVENPREKLEVAGNIIVKDAIIGSAFDGKWNDPAFLTLKGSEDEFASKIMLNKGSTSNNNELKIINPLPDAEIQFNVGGIIMFNIKSDETVLGRPDQADYSLKVNGKIWAHEVEVQLLDWWDDVFCDDYKLISIHELEQYINNNKRLPDIPSEEQALENGIELGEMNALLLKKVEELTLYVIQLKNELDKVKMQQSSK